MRPRHFAPDIVTALMADEGGPACFNEAEAFCPGYCVPHRNALREEARFNEAEAFCPGYSS